MNELLTPCLILLTASLCSIPFKRSLNTPVIDETVSSIDWIAIWIAWTACAFNVSSYPLNMVFKLACWFSSLPGWELSIKATPPFL
jgi:hypothetical protein